MQMLNWNAYISRRSSHGAKETTTQLGKLKQKVFKEFQATLRVFDKHFLKGGPFFGGSTAINIGDLLAANTLEQVHRVALSLFIQH